MDVETGRLPKEWACWVAVDEDIPVSYRVRTGSQLSKRISRFHQSDNFRKVRTGSEAVSNSNAKEKAVGSQSDEIERFSLSFDHFEASPKTKNLLLTLGLIAEPKTKSKSKSTKSKVSRFVNWKLNHDI
mmetsp:Transcript_2437/g.3117  ORF Transcript_2437/g.3117 Transcript_2437/m.3117 type:complete len:129 (+) Transcript_2437:306-692(+)